MVAANGQHVGRDAVGGLVNRCAGDVAGKFDVLARFAHRQVAVERDKAVDVDVQRAAGLHQVALGAVQAQGQFGAGTGGHAELGLARTRGSAHVAVIDYRVGSFSRFGFAGLVDGHAHTGGLDRQVVAQTDKADAAGRGLQAGPAACGCCINS